jgi:glycosyltransferase involved in cell wall biosynthesis
MQQSIRYKHSQLARERHLLTQRTPSWWLFWGSLSLVLYTYLGFPLLVVLRWLLRLPRPIQRGDDTPLVSLIIVVHNEAAIISNKLDNLLELDYPHDQLEVIVASDGSVDETNALVEGYSHHGVRLLALPHQGKNRSLNAAVAAARGDILVFSDADSSLAPDALRVLVAPFSDPEVGGVAGQFKSSYSPSQGANQQIRRSLNRSIKQCLSTRGSINSAEQLYAIRRALFKPVPPSVNDDFYISLLVPAAYCRLVFEPRAMAFALPGAVPSAPFQRKIRVMTRSVYTIWSWRRLLNPVAYGFFAMQLFSGKLLRHLVSVPLLVLGVTAPTLWQHGWLYKLATLGQLAFHSAGALGFLLRSTRIGPGVFRWPFTFDMSHVANLVAIVNLLRGKRYDTWTPQR